MHIRAATVIAAACLALAGCKKGEVYDRSLDETRTVLKSVEVPLHYFGPSAVVDASMTPVDERTIEWKVTSKGSELLRYTATLEPESEHQTRVTLTLVGSTSGKFGNVEERLTKFRALRNLYQATMAEATDSALEARPFDTTRFYPQIAAASMQAAAMMSPPGEKPSKNN